MGFRKRKWKYKESTRNTEVCVVWPPNVCRLGYRDANSWGSTDPQLTIHTTLQLGVKNGSSFQPTGMLLHQSSSYIISKPNWKFLTLPGVAGSGTSLLSCFIGLPKVIAIVHTAAATWVRIFVECLWRFLLNWKIIEMPKCPWKRSYQMYHKTCCHAGGHWQCDRTGFVQRRSARAPNKLPWTITVRLR